MKTAKKTAEIKIFDRVSVEYREHCHPHASNSNGWEPICGAQDGRKGRWH